MGPWLPAKAWFINAGAASVAVAVVRKKFLRFILILIFLPVDRLLFVFFIVVVNLIIRL